MKDGFFRIAAATPVIRVADCEHNGAAILGLMEQAAQQQVGAVVFPELCVTGYTCGDLFRDSTLIQGAEATLANLLDKTKEMDLIAVIGIPVAVNAELYNTAAVIYKGKILGLSAKRSIPNYSEFYEARHFSSAPATREISFCGQTVPLGGNLIFRCSSIPELALGVEICEDLWMPEPPSANLASCGATVILNPSASDEVIGKAAYRRALVTGQSGRLICAYAYADAGEGESSTDLVFSGHNLIAENGTLLAEAPLFSTGLVCADVDLQRLIQERRRMTTWQSSCCSHEIAFDFTAKPLEVRRNFPCLPFVPSDSSDLNERCELILSMQAEGLKTRLRHTGGKNVVLGLSGGLDSTLALLVVVRAFDSLNLDRKGITAVSMPGFGTTSRTKSNANGLAEQLGVTFREISIGDAVLQHFKDIGHDPQVHDVTYENSQARERTQVLMDIANQTGGLVIGTGDLSELALGWATYNGDHMSMYGVNASIPKTLVRHLVRHAAEHSEPQVKKLLLDVLDTPVSPELLPPVNGEISQKTEDLVGPYELHDFFLFYMLRFGFRPSKIYRMARLAFAGVYEEEIIKKWLLTFYRRFFSQQFKRSCLPDGPKVGSVTLSPRGDFRMPSDASAQLWLKEIESL
ncbi:NAD(+) synthase [Clostridium minihomine]|uniref:NAD(+) synthase n=1 Tax=Clostridium minihomine TaxID=2045012 RepID=UPI000C78EFA1|nr:NAD(+) synthase [Clostridium minihomine]